MIETLDKLIHLLNDLTPLGLCGGLAFIIYSIIGKHGKVRLISDNHLSGLPTLEANIQKLVDSSTRQEGMLGEIRDGINYLKGRSNGRT